MGIAVKKLKKTILFVVIVSAAFAAYVIIINRNSVNMTARQKILRAVYPDVDDKNYGTGTDVLANKDAMPPVSFYALQMAANDGSLFSFSKGKKYCL